MPNKDTIEQVINAIREVERICDEPLSPTAARKRIEEVTIRLAEEETDFTNYGGIQSNIANALTRTYLRKDLRELKSKAG